MFRLVSKHYLGESAEKANLAAQLVFHLPARLPDLSRKSRLSVRVLEPDVFGRSHICSFLERPRRTLACAISDVVTRKGKKRRPLVQLTRPCCVVSPAAPRFALWLRSCFHPRLLVCVCPNLLLLSLSAFPAAANSFHSTNLVVLPFPFLFITGRAPRKRTFAPHLDAYLEAV